MDISTSIAATNQQTNYSKASNSFSNLNPNFYSNGMFLLCKFLKLFISVHILKLMRALHLFISHSHHQLPGPLCSQLQFQRCVYYLFYYSTLVNMFSANARHFYFIVYRHRLHSLQLGNQQARHLPRYVSTYNISLSELTFKHNNSIPWLIFQPQLY